MAWRGVAARWMATCVVLCGLTTAWADVHLKSRDRQTRLPNRASRAKTRQALRSHLILDLAEAPTTDTVQTLAARGMQVVAYLPVTGVLVGVDGEPDLAGLPLNGFDSLQREDKLSPELGREGETAAPTYYIVEFHADVPWADRRALVTEAGLAIRDHQDLVGDHMLVSGTLQQVESLADWDEVAYIFPASGELVTGLPLIGCLGGAAAAGQVGQLTQRVGDGWDGPGLGSANLTYSLQALTSKIPADQIQQELQRAMAQWSKAVKVNFAKASTIGGAKNINILFGTREHGDSYAFDGPGKVLAHTFYPAPPNPEPIAGDLHFDEEENWKVGDDVDLFSVALHELGHALGLGHSDVPNAVMYPYYRRATALTQEDISTIRMLYEAAPDEQVPAAPAALVLTVSSPANASVTTAASASISGYLDNANGLPHVNWSNDRGGSGSAIVSANGSRFAWQIGGVVLSTGDNRITITAVDGDNRTTTAVVTIQKTAAAPPPPPPIPTPTPTPAPAPPPTPPTQPAHLTINVIAPVPSSNVSQNPITANGTVSGGTGTPTVRWSNDRGYSGTAVVTAAQGGGYRWDVTPLAVLPGVNNITITAKDTVGETSVKSFAVSYTVPDRGSNGANKPPQLTIASPSSSFLMTPSYSIALRGTATDSSGVAQVTWKCTCGTEGTARGTTQWTIPSVSLTRGLNIITVRAKDTAGLESSAETAVFRY